jgi:hypothetical protein
MSFTACGGLPKVSPQPRGEHALYVDATDFDPDALTLDMLARFALSARRCGYRIVLRHASAELAELIELAGLSEVLPVVALRPGSTPPRC